MSGRDDVKAVRDAAAAAEREALNVAEFYRDRVNALDRLLFSCSEAALDAVAERIKRECPGVVPS